MADNYNGDEYLYDTHTLFIKCDCATTVQIHDAINEAITKYQNDNSVDLECRFKVNRVETREGIPVGIAFVFLTNSAVYYMLVGKNIDGSDRVEYKDDPSWSPPVNNKSSNDSGWSIIAPPIKSSKMNWADETDDDIWCETTNISKSGTVSKIPSCPKISFPLEPLMKLPPYHLTEDQIKDKKQKIIGDNEGKKDFDVSLIKISDVAYFNVNRALAPPVDPKYMPNILKCKDIPNWVTKEDLKASFTSFATDSTTIHNRTVRGVHLSESYPFVNINDNHVGFVIFDPHTNDAYFALHMMKKTFIKKKQSNGLVNNVTLIFDHSYKTDRDLMQDINQRAKPNRRDNYNFPSNQSYTKNKPTSRSDNSNGEFRNPRKVNRASPNITPDTNQVVINPVGRFDLLTSDDE